jgi:WD40 repeat protein
MAQTSIGNAINNAMHISQHRSEMRLLVCNNDETVKIFSLPTLEHVTSINLHVAVNGLSVSPDGTKMVAVGDTNQAFLYSIQGTNYRLVSALPTVNDAGFSCAWDTASEKFAVACQDGYACVWDVRSLSHKLALIESTQRSQKGAARCIKFTRSNSMDLLAFSEHVSVVNVVDSRTFSCRQAIRVAPANTDLHISGLAFSPDSKSLLVGLELYLLEFDVDTASRRSFAIGNVI